MSFGDEKGEKKLPCCISHEFFHAASKNPSLIAVVHAATTGRHLPHASPPSGLDEDAGAAHVSSSSSPPVYPGDECFTYADILSAVDSLSRRLRRVLDGGDDPDLVRPQEGLHGEMECSSANANRISTFHGIPQLVGVYIGPSVEYIVAVLSILRCGEAFLALDPLLPQESILSIISSARLSLIIKHAPTSQMGRSWQPDADDWITDKSKCSVLYLSVRAGLTGHLTQLDLVWPCESSSPRKFCYVMYTSGSTGKPKGVCGTEIGNVRIFRDRD